MALLEVKDLTAAYGGIQALRGVSLTVEEGQIVAVLGANGAGKSTLLKCISSVMKPTGGTIEFLGKPVSQKPYEVVEAGLVQVPEARQIFAKLTVAEIDPSHLHMPEIKCEEVRDTVSSLRLDAVCSTGFRMARGKAVDMISSGHVQVNWRPCTKADKLLTEGDTVSARGFGKFQLAVVGGVTKKGRTAIVVKRYI